MKILLLVLAAGAVLGLPDFTVHHQWTQYKIKHQKQYTSPEEEAKRLAIFTNNLAQIDAHNVRYANGEVTYSKAMNKFGDLTAEEFLAWANRRALRNTTHLPHKPHVMSTVDATDEVDWRTKNAVTDVVNEGSCGASWAFSTVGAVEGQLAIKSGQLTPLSAQNLIDCSDDFGNAGCDGGLTNSAFDYMQSNGIMSASDYPYQESKGNCQFDASRAVTKISSYVDVDSMSEGSLQDAVGSVGPVAAAVHVTEGLQFYYGGIFFDDQCFPTVDLLSQGVLVVGYGQEMQYQYWIVKNSWGTDWGEDGYFWLIRNYGNNCGIATSAAYPVL